MASMRPLSPSETPSQSEEWTCEVLSPSLFFLLPTAPPLPTKLCSSIMKGSQGHFFSSGIVCPEEEAVSLPLLAERNGRKREWGGLYREPLNCRVRDYCLAVAMEPINHLVAKKPELPGASAPSPVSTSSLPHGSLAPERPVLGPICFHSSSPTAAIFSVLTCQDHPYLLDSCFSSLGYSIAAKHMDSGPRLPEFKAQIQSFPSYVTLAKYLNSLNPSFPHYKVGRLCPCLPELW